MAKINPFRFSTKYEDDETDLVYYVPGRYCNSLLGRWLSRDLFAEEGGVNLYAFAANSPINSVDYLGFATLDGATRTVTLANCDIVVVYGHGSPKRSRGWKWSFKDADCSGGASIMCFPLNNMDSLPEAMRTWNAWGGAPLEDPEGDTGKPWVSVKWGMSPTGPDWFNALGTHFPNANKVLATVVVNAQTMAREICKRKKCGCSTVSILFVEVDHHGDPMDSKKAYDGVPVQPDIVVDCKTCAPQAH